MDREVRTSFAAFMDKFMDREVRAALKYAVGRTWWSFGAFLAAPFLFLPFAEHFLDRPLPVEASLSAVAYVTLVLLIFTGRVATIIKNKVSAGRPFELDPDASKLWYRGRRNVAFGVDTINDTFEALTRENPSGLKQAGKVAGEKFAEAFNIHLRQHKFRKTAANVDDVKKWWLEYDGNAGFGRMDASRLQQRNKGVEGQVKFFDLFTTDRRRHGRSPLCTWMEGYLEGFLNHALVLAGDENEMIVVKHGQCGGEYLQDPEYPCIFEVTKAPRPDIVPQSEN